MAEAGTLEVTELDVELDHEALCQWQGTFLFPDECTAGVEELGTAPCSKSRAMCSIHAEAIRNSSLRFSCSGCRTFHPAASIVWRLI